MSSGGMYIAPLSADDLDSVSGSYRGARAYARTKRMQVVLADAWAQRLAGAARSATSGTAADVRVESITPVGSRRPAWPRPFPRFRS